MRLLTFLKNLLVGRRLPAKAALAVQVLSRSEGIVEDETDPLPFATIAAEAILKEVGGKTVPLPFSIEGYTSETHDYHIFGNWSVIEPDSAVDLQRFQIGCQALAKVVARFTRKSLAEFDVVEVPPYYSGAGAAVSVQLGNVIVYCSASLKTTGNLLIEITVRVRRDQVRIPKTPWRGRRLAGEPSRVAYQNSRKFGFYVHE